ncbi:MAG: SHOCT domain-containing protein [Firmicutes bacterium]|nr:SHOCT domain-containing protein [Bacillota bacterium]
MQRLIIGIALTTALLLTSGCIAIGGRNETSTNPPTLGKELIDLKTAHEQGALTDAEFENAKAQLISDSSSRSSRQ